VEERKRFAPSGHEDSATSLMILFAGKRTGHGVIDDDYYSITDPEARHDELEYPLQSTRYFCEKVAIPVRLAGLEF
jgi:hypothetical protein